MANRLPQVSIVGAGTVGTTLATALYAKGYPFASVVSRTGASAVALARLLKCPRASTLTADLSPDTEILLLTVPDGAVAGVAKQVAAQKQLRFKKMFVIHCSGVHTAAVLAPLGKKGAAIASMHPIQSFPARFSASTLRGRLKGIYYGVDGEIGRAHV